MYLFFQLQYIIEQMWKERDSGMSNSVPRMIFITGSPCRCYSYSWQQFNHFTPESRTTGVSGLWFLFSAYSLSIDSLSIIVTIKIVRLVSYAMLFCVRAIFSQRNVEWQFTHPLFAVQPSFTNFDMGFLLEFL